MALQDAHARLRASSERLVQRGSSINGAQVRVRAPFKQPRHGRRMTTGGRKVKRGGALAIGHVHPRPPRQQGRCDFLTTDRRQVQGCVSVGVGRVHGGTCTTRRYTKRVCYEKKQTAHGEATHQP